MLSAEIYVFGIIVYLLLGSGRKQYWADGVVAAKKSNLEEPNVEYYSPSDVG